MFEPIDQNLSFPQREEELIEKWRQEKLFDRVQEKTADGRPYVFFEGPPTANAKPGIHHAITRAFKDALPRYQTMRGRRVDRKAGWDTHGLPVELQVEKKLGITNKKEIESYGIAAFNRKCRDDVWTYISEWQKFTERLGFWLDFDHPYVTYHSEYIELVWAILKHVYSRRDTMNRPLLYQGYKVVQYCPRCGTALSSHEVAQGYKTVTDNSVFVKFRTSNLLTLVVWTTTPWTLPGNVALAVGPEIDYLVIESNNRQERLVVAKQLLEQLRQEGIADGEVVQSLKGKDLVGLSYEPLWPGVIKDNGQAFRILPANFVTTNEGTGIVHIATMYGDDDYNLGVEFDLPAVHTVDEEGKFLIAGKLFGLPAKGEVVEEIIFSYLTEKEALVSVVPFSHDYPFCWRCDTPLLNYARSSWFIRMSELRQEMMERNAGVNWIPSNLKTGRMGEWLEGAKDWSISRERYWGTPLPIWQCQKEHLSVIGSLSELQKQAPPRAKFYIMRHGESQSNVKSLISCWPEKETNGLTEKGREEISDLADKLKKLGIKVIVSSDLQRAKETAEAVQRITGAKLVFDHDLREIDFADLNGQSVTKFVNYDSGEKLFSVRKRMINCLMRHLGNQPTESILFVSHADPLWVLASSLAGLREEEMLTKKPSFYLKTAELRELALPNWPFDEDGEINLHRPYIDQIKIVCETCHGIASRVTEVADVWLDSGSVPFVQWGEADFASHYPADYISEAIDQTRGWFYTLMAVATLMNKEAPYRNVICLGHLLDSQGKKMSKSKGNIIDPWMIMNKYGADALRLYFYSVNSPGESLSFSEQDLQTVQRRVLLLWWNVYSYFVTYANQADWQFKEGAVKSTSILDRWIIARLRQTTRSVTDGLDKYDLLSASRGLADFVDDMSTWYLRRSRDRFAANSTEAFSTLYYVLINLAKISAPFTPFVSDLTYRNLTGGSVHLADWPESEAVDHKLLREMIVVRQLVSNGLDSRAQANIKIRQKLAKVFLLADKKLVDYQQIIADELNVKEVILVDELPSGKKLVISGAAALDTEITKDLILDGLLRELIRFVQDWRKKQGLTVSDHLNISWQSDDLEVVSLMCDKQLVERLTSTTKSTIFQLKQSSDAQLISVDLNGHLVKIELSAA